MLGDRPGGACRAWTTRPASRQGAPASPPSTFRGRAQPAELHPRSPRHGNATNPYPPTAARCPAPAASARYRRSSRTTTTRPHQNDFASDTGGARGCATTPARAGVAPDTFWTDALVGDVTAGWAGDRAYDQNGDKLMWVRTQAEVRGRERAIVGLIRIEPRPIQAARLRDPGRPLQDRPTTATTPRRSWTQRRLRASRFGAAPRAGAESSRTASSTSRRRARSCRT